MVIVYDGKRNILQTTENKWIGKKKLLVWILCGNYYTVFLPIN